MSRTSASKNIRGVDGNHCAAITALHGGNGRNPAHQPDGDQAKHTWGGGSTLRRQRATAIPAKGINTKEEKTREYLEKVATSSPAPHAILCFDG